MDEVITNKAAVACCCKRTAGDGVLPGWLPDSALLLQLEEQLLDKFDGKPDFGEMVLFDYDVTFCADVNLLPVAWRDGVGGVHAFTIRVCVRWGNVVSYEITGRNKNEFFSRVLPHWRDVKNS